MDDAVNNMNKHELISALADGELQGESLARGIEAAGDAEGRRAWAAYHLVGDALRSGELARATPSDAFMSRLKSALEQEPQPARTLVEPIRVLPAAAAIDPARPAANDGARWKLVAGVASVAAVAAIGWNLVGAQGQPAGPQLASVTAPPSSSVVLTSTQGGTMIRDERLDKLLAAHRQVSGATALQTPAGFVRNATFEGPAR